MCEPASVLRYMYIVLSKKNYIPVNLHYFRELNVKATSKQKNVHLLMGVFRRKIWLKSKGKSVPLQAQGVQKFPGI